MKKLLMLCLSLCLIGCSAQELTKPSADAITLHITVIDEVEGETLFDDDLTVEQEVSTLSDFLEEADSLNVVMEEGEYGKTILSICNVATEDWNKGPWWLFESDTNQACVEAGMCPAASELAIEDGDSFTFTYTDTF